MYLAMKEGVVILVEFYCKGMTLNFRHKELLLAKKQSCYFISIKKMPRIEGRGYLMTRYIDPS